MMDILHYILSILRCGKVVVTDALWDAAMPRSLVDNQKRIFIRGICVARPITFHKTI